MSLNFGPLLLGDAFCDMLFSLAVALPSEAVVSADKGKSEAVSLVPGVDGAGFGVSIGVEAQVAEAEAGEAGLLGSRLWFLKGFSRGELPSAG